MSLILKHELKKLQVGFPSRVPSPRVSGAVLSGTNNIEFGDLVMYDGNGRYKKVASATGLADIAGFCLGTNVKLADEENHVYVKPGEAFNLVLPDSFMAIKLADSVENIGDIKPNGQVYVNLTTGALTASSSGTTALTGVVFTGVAEAQGTVLVAEIYIK